MSSKETELHPIVRESVPSKILNEGRNAINLFYKRKKTKLENALETKKSDLAIILV